MPSIQKGQCLCSSIHFEITAPPLFTHACHCLDCQKICNSSYGLSMFVLHHDFNITKGETRVTYPPQKHGISEHHDCALCGCNIYRTHSYLKGLIFPATSAFNKQDWFAPQAHIFTRSKQAWVRLDPNIPTFEKYYEEEKVWPKKSLQRLKSMQTQINNVETNDPKTN